MEITVRSSIDKSMQPSLFYKAREEKRPLLVGLHTWSFDRFNQIENMLPLAQKYDFNLLLPEFRGPNLDTNVNCTEACGSDLARADVFDAISYVIDEYNVDKENVFLLGLSGGGHMALLLGAADPTLFRAIGAYVPITDLERWTEENPNYKKHVLACCSNRTEEMRYRSPVSYYKELSRANLKIFHGKYDNVVPVTHSMELYSKIYEYNPTSRVFLDIFDGGHEIEMDVAMRWILTQYKKCEKVAVTG